MRTINGADVNVARPWSKWTSGCVILALLFGHQVAIGDNSGNTDVLSGQVCMQEAAGIGLNCTANDVRIANVTNVTVLDDGCAFPGDTVTFTADFEVLLTATARHDIGLYFAEDGDPNGDGALTGNCTVATPAYAPDPPWLDLDNLCGTSGPNKNKCILNPATSCTTSADCQGQPFSDTCGDINSAAVHNPLFPQITLTVACIDTELPVGDGFLNIPNCTSWRQPGANDLCQDPLDAFPGTAAKCRCDPGGTDVAISVPGQFSSIDKVTLDADGNPLPGDPTQFDFSLAGPDADLPVNFMLADADTPYTSPGLDAGTYSLLEAAEAGWTLVSAICVSDKGQPDQDLIASGGSVIVNGGESLSCTFTNQVAFAADPSIAIDKFIDLPAANADADGSGDVSEGDVLTYQFTVTNTGNVTLDPVTVSDPITGPVICTATSLAPAGEPGDSTSCTATYTVQAGDLGGNIDNTATATGTPPSGPGDNVTAQDSETVPVPTPSLAIDKPAPSNADNDGSGDVSAGDVLTYTITATNDGTANLTNVVVSDPMITPSSQTCAGPVAPGGTCVLVGTYTVQASDLGTTITNIGTADSVQTDPVMDAEAVDVPQSDLSITKDDGVTAVTAGDGVTYLYTITVTNAPLAFGGANLTNVMVADTWPAEFVQGIVSPSQGSCTVGPNFSCSLGTVLAGGTATITVSYTVPSDIPAGFVTNVVAVSADQPDPDTENNTAEDTNEVLTEIELGIDKWFDPAEIEIPLIPQGISRTFIIAVSNSGPSDATDVIVSDLVNSFLDVQSITVDGNTAWPAGTEACSVDKDPAYAPQELACTVDVPVGPTVEIVVTYLVAPFLGSVGDGTQVYSDEANDGAEFRFIFENDYILEGNALTGPVYLTDPQGNVEVLDLSGQTLTKNDFYFTPTNGDPGFLLHLSCSDSFDGGYSDSGAGPSEIDDANWKIDYYSIARYKQGGEFFRNCGNVITPFDLENQATADGTDSNNPTLPTGPQPGLPGTDGEQVTSNVATVTVKQGIELDKFQNKSKHASIHMTNYTDEDKEIAYIDIEWPASNGDLRQISIDGSVVWAVDFPGVGIAGNRRQAKIFGDMTLHDSDPAICLPSGVCDTTRGWTMVPSDWVLEKNVEERIAFHFRRKSSSGNYVVRLQFRDGSFLSLTIP